MTDIRLTFDSYQLASGKWIPRIIERQYLGNEVKERHLTFDGHFKSKKEADEFAKTKVKTKS